MSGGIGPLGAARADPVLGHRPIAELRGQERTTKVAPNGRGGQAQTTRGSSQLPRGAAPHLPSGCLSRPRAPVSCDPAPVGRVAVCHGRSISSLPGSKRRSHPAPRSQLAGRICSAGTCDGVSGTHTPTGLVRASEGPFARPSILPPGSRRPLGFVFPDHFIDPP